MALFSYIAIDSKGNSINKTVDLPDRTSVIDSLTKQGLRPVSIKEATAKDNESSFDKYFGNNKIKSEQLVMFTRQLSSMVGAGVPLLRALSALSEHVAESPALKKILIEIIKSVESGSTLGDALAKYPNTFNDVYVNMVRAGEAAGILDDILARLAIQQEKSATIKKKIKSSMAYPVVLMGITVLAFFGLMLFVIPEIGKVIKDLGGPEAEMPALTAAMLSISGFFVKNWLIIIVGLIIAIVSFLSFIKTKSGKKWFHNLILHIPILKTMLRKIAVARFARTFSALTQAGVAVLEAISVTARAVGNVMYEESLMQAESEVKNGKSLSSVISQDPLFPPIVSQMLLVGEETGQTEKVLVKVADFYEEEVDIAIGSINTIIEPVMIVIMGSMVGLIAASVMLPIAGLSQNIK